MNDFIAKKVQEYESDTYRLVKDNEDGTGLFIYKGESVILKRCKRGYWKDPSTGNCVPKEQLSNTSQPKEVHADESKQQKPTEKPKEETSSEPKAEKPKQKAYIAVPIWSHVTFVVDHSPIGEKYHKAENKAKRRAEHLKSYVGTSDLYHYKIFKEDENIRQKFQELYDSVEWTYKADFDKASDILNDIIESTKDSELYEVNGFDVFLNYTLKDIIERGKKDVSEKKKLKEKYDKACDEYQNKYEWYDSVSNRKLEH